ncbi:Tn7 transposase TnsA N-terminal domain-containing protein [Acinetobacter sp. ANC 3926]|uniref:TnsA endonuclease N-terminal domain-containing protein n=1 Tax=Acinetobacter genomosp. 15BJ TaxID=106651 RepID=R9BDA6_9GAMM|nr:hypothetical protein [Acinetobacter genomosp. 15BJ]EOR10356.1 hypothetical protein F896_00484 [Acinetobacter genomosp. 15BJ]MCH7293663.1 Tn7 transposase TnsA N-terminal domain-containing protein [Acinetobacter genomosp. 15BJ]
MSIVYQVKTSCFLSTHQKFEIPDNDGECSIYTPDFEILYTSGVRKYAEVKPSEYTQTEHYQSLFSRFNNFLNDTNTDFLIVSEIEIYQQPLLSNYEKLYQYKKRPLLKMKNLQQCAEDIHDLMPLAQLVNRLGDRAHLREIYSWIALGYLRFDMNSEPLSMTTEVKFDVC